jgi:DNA primase
LLVPSNSQKEFLATATETYYQNLKESDDAKEYLKSRGISGASAQYFKLGYVGSPLPGHEQYSGKLVIPYLTPGGVVSIRFRRIGDGDGPKYLGLPGDTLRPYNVAALHKPGQFMCITEGEVDAITAHQAGLPVVGLPGVASLREYSPRLFQGYETVYALADNDDKGQGNEFAEKIATLVPFTRIILMPPGHDVNSFVTSEGAQALLDRLEIK